MIGSALTKALIEKGYDVIILTRNPQRNKPSGRISYAQWDVNGQTIDESAIQKADYIVHLAGANVADGRWTARRKQEIVDSRVKSGELLVKTLLNVPNHIKAVISSSAIGYYGPDPRMPNANPFVETDPHDHSFLGETCEKWERAILPVTELYKRLVILRTGIVLSRDGGAFAEFVKPLKFGVAPVMGSGTQVVSWIHIHDLVRMYTEAIEHSAWRGVYNAVAPYPVSNKDLISEIALLKKRFNVPAPVPAFALKLLLGEMSVEVLKSATVSSRKAEENGFIFMYPTIQRAIRELVDPDLRGSSGTHS